MLFSELTLKQGESLLLASASPRRAALLNEAGVAFQQCSSAFDESKIHEESPAKLVRLLAEGKSEAISAEDRLILSADTLVALDKRIFGKPANLPQAKQYLLELSGKIHQVHTGVCLRRGNVKFSWTSTSLVTFNTLTDDDIDAYISLVNPLDKAGAYAIQSHCDIIVKSFSGFLSTIIGLPIEEVLNIIRG